MQTKQATHTPGPWHVAGDAVYSGTRTEKGGWVNSEQVFPRYVEDPASDTFQRLEANARLIAAAPELLEACEAAFMQFEHNGDEAPEDRAILDQLQHAIAKARG